MNDWLSLRTLVQATVVLIGLMLVTGYVVYQARFLIIGPQITLSEELPLHQNVRQVTLSGSANNISRLWLNGRPIFTNPEGEFAATVILENGYTVTTLMAEDRFGRTTTVSRQFVYTPASFIR